MNSFAKIFPVFKIEYFKPFHFPFSMSCMWCHTRLWLQFSLTGFLYTIQFLFFLILSPLYGSINYFPSSIIYESIFHLDMNLFSTSYIFDWVIKSKSTFLNPTKHLYIHMLIYIYIYKYIFLEFCFCLELFFK